MLPALSLFPVIPCFPVILTCWRFLIFSCWRFSSGIWWFLFTHILSDVLDADWSSKCVFEYCQWKGFTVGFPMGIPKCQYLWLFSGLVHFFLRSSLSFLLDSRTGCEVLYLSRKKGLGVSSSVLDLISLFSIICLIPILIYAWDLHIWNSFGLLSPEVTFPIPYGGKLYQVGNVTTYINRFSNRSPFFSTALLASPFL